MRRVPSRLLSDDAAAAVAGVESTRTERVTEHGVNVTTNVKLHTRDSIAALALLTKIRGMVKTKMELTGPNGGPIEHAVRFYLPAPARVREPVVIDATTLPEGPRQNGAQQNARANEDNSGYTEN